MSLDGSGLGGAMAEVYTARKFHRENMMKVLMANAATTTGAVEDNGGGYSRWFFGKLCTKKNSAKVCDHITIE
ncbi:unnamed protein product [Cochlearia groenlandica]